MAVLVSRDQKGLYSGAKAEDVKNVACIDIEFAPPTNPDLIITNNQVIDDFSNIINLIKVAIEKKFHGPL